MHYIYKVKVNTGAYGSSESEFRVAVAALMMANKFLDEYVIDHGFYNWLCADFFQVTRTLTRPGPTSPAWN